MGVPNDDVVLIQKGKRPGEPHVITVNCPDKTGLGCDICRIILDFGLYITKGVSFYFNQLSTRPTCSPVYLLKLFCLDRKGLLHDVTQVLCELELSIQRVKVTTTPDGRVLDLFFITDNRELLHTKKRQDETCEQLHAVLGESCINCELQLAGPECDCHQGVTSLSPVVAEELFRFELSDKETRLQALSPDMTKLKKANVVVDNSLSPAHTLLQIHCVDHKGLLYDIMRTLKDCNMKISYGRFSPNSQGYRDLDLFIQQKDGKKIVDPEKQSAICSRLKMEMLHPLRVIIANRGPDTELLVANPVELCGKGRPRVFYDVTLALKVLGICVFSAAIGRYSTSEREWEIYRFLLDENCKFQLSSMVAREQIVDRVRRALMGW
ncbi:ACT domain-containing protein ACR9 [Citrus sinensis]|nr:ACT domain-containing protein ACR9 [Citrus sinensis]